MKTNTTKPESLLTSFTRTPILICVGVAVAIHVVVIGATSIPQLFTGGDEAVVEEQAEPEAEAVREVMEARPDNGETTVPETGEGESEESMTDIERRVREVADPDEIPRTPDPLDIDLGDTN